jgi:acylphosphatase
MMHKKLPRQMGSQAPGWLFADMSPLLRSSRAERLKEWRRVERGEPRPVQYIERWRLIVRGKVQGVGYRAACSHTAKQMGLSGWVRNSPDGSVEIQVEGPVHQLTELQLWAERGPRGASVSQVITSQLTPSREDWFEIRA